MTRRRFAAVSTESLEFRRLLAAGGLSVQGFSNRGFEVNPVLTVAGDKILFLGRSPDWAYSLRR